MLKPLDSVTSIYTFKTVTLTGGAKVRALGAMRVKNGSFNKKLGTDDLIKSGRLHVDLLDLGSTKRIVSNEGALKYDELYGRDLLQPVFNVEVGLRGDVIGKKLNADTLNVTKGYLHVDEVKSAKTPLFDSAKVVNDLLVSEQDLLLTNGTVFSSLGGQIQAAKDITVDKGSVITAGSYKTKKGRLHIKSTSLVLSKDSKIHADYAGGAPAKKPTWNGDTSGDINSGGSHGGLGRWLTKNVFQEVYGDFRLPDTPGRGGGQAGCYSSSFSKWDPKNIAWCQTEAGRGGGVVVIEASLNVNIHGRISANGHGASSSADKWRDKATYAASWSGGAGGSVRIHAPTISGTGKVAAVGGHGRVHSKSVRPAGGGGRVAFLDYANMSEGFSPQNILNNVSTEGGYSPGYSSTPTLRAAAGTIFLRKQSQKWGDLLIHGTSGSVTNLPTRAVVLPATQVVNINQKVVTLGQQLDNDFYKGVLLNMDVGNGLGLVNFDKLHRVKSNLGSFVTMEADMAAVTKVNNAVRTTIVVDNLHVGGDATFDASDADVVVMEGDFLSGNKETLAFNGGVQAERLELKHVLEIQLGNNDASAKQLFTSAGEGKLALTLNNAVADLPALNLQSLAMKGGALNTPSLKVANSMKLDGGKITTQDYATKGGTIVGAGNLDVSGPVAAPGGIALSGASQLKGTAITTDNDVSVIGKSTLTGETLSSGGALTVTSSTFKVTGKTDFGGDVTIADSTVTTGNFSGMSYKQTGSSTTVSTGATELKDFFASAGKTNMGSLKTTGDGTQADANVLTIGKENMTIGGEWLMKKLTKLTIAKGWDKTHGVYRLMVTAKSFVIDSQAHLTLDGKGYPQGAWHYAVSEKQPGVQEGGCHAGFGGGPKAPKCVPYDDYRSPMWPGLAGVPNFGSAGAGGGVVHLFVTNGIAINGKITANGLGGYGGGAGGAILLKGKSLQGNGLVSANGGAASLWSNYSRGRPDTTAAAAAAWSPSSTSR